jgi:hypothetical protein
MIDRLVPKRRGGRRVPELVAVASVIAAGVIGVNCSNRSDTPITQAELVRRTQELLDAIGPGDRKPFERYFADDSFIHDEKGHSWDKNALLADLSVPPPDWSGGITLNHPQSRIVGNTAILSYDMDEIETISGQTVRARYHTTDVWLRRNGTWQIVAEQALRYYDDPAPGRPDMTKYADYEGVYELAPGRTVEVSSEGETLIYQRSGKAKVLLLPETGDLFFRKGVEGRLLFRRDAPGKVDALIDRRNNEDIVWRKIR